ncbi:diguanylate cyclase (GGDEF) domain-containing protein [Desulfocurvibacter africanus PCS]|uniref:diguanylate cyclase n=1 Tax=Desulfocurvibacter africanus PCS TaxID=1262666 RepID=M5PVH4_DESAF|nr:diguanylate cyclase [Desulfocurvibacter africanus]EMG38059.1 diguanylate cyclase (GGDEF) domain-containing protein [Desulfocurvibacter africanus PCS]
MPLQHPRTHMRGQDKSGPQAEQRAASPIWSRPWGSYAAFVGFTTFTFAAFIAVLFIWIHRESQTQMRELVLAQARSLFESILVTRHWNANLGGVYAVKTDEVQSNPYLEHPDVETTDGRTLTLKNPALMVVEISERSRQERLFSFRMIGDRPLNPRNGPDELERVGLEAFRAGDAEFWRMEDLGPAGPAVLRYMAPLRIDAGCMPCHAKQGYEVGDINGAISVRLDIKGALARHDQWFRQAATAAAAASMLLLALVLLYLRRLRMQIAQAQDLCELLANTDVLTGVPNRRQLMARLEEELARAMRTGQPLACALMDVDHFKRVNDTHGHQKGDTVLKALARIARETVRGYDVVGRFGGEEFLLVLPGTDSEHAVELAERVRLAVQDRLATETGLPSVVTISLGVATLRPGDNVESLVKRADDALYRAKEKGRNRVEREE